MLSCYYLRFPSKFFQNQGKRSSSCMQKGTVNGRLRFPVRACGPGVMREDLAEAPARNQPSRTAGGVGWRAGEVSLPLEICWRALNARARGSLTKAAAALRRLDPFPPLARATTDCVCRVQTGCALPWNAWQWMRPFPPARAVKNHSRQGTPEALSWMA